MRKQQVQTNWGLSSVPPPCTLSLGAYFGDYLHLQGSMQSVRPIDPSWTQFENETQTDSKPIRRIPFRFDVRPVVLCRPLRARVWPLLGQRSTPSLELTMYLQTSCKHGASHHVK